jgi:hypothetical protein
MPPRLSFNTDLTSSVNAPLVGYSQQQQRVFPSDVLRDVRSVLLGASSDITQTLIDW